KMEKRSHALPGVLHPRRLMIGNHNDSARLQLRRWRAPISKRDDFRWAIKGLVASILESPYVRLRHEFCRSCIDDNETALRREISLHGPKQCFGIFWRVDENPRG